MRNKRFLILLLVLTITTGWLFYRIHSPQAQSLPTVTHASIYSQPEFYDEAYANAKPSKPIPGAAGVLVNHHLLAAQFIAEAMQTIATNEPVTVVLVSPNHFSVGQGSVIGSRASWDTPYGTLQPDLNALNRLVNTQVATIEEAPFEHEHGVTGIIAFIKRSIPNARVVPLIVNDRLSVAQATALAGRIAEIVSKNTLLVGSFDFSHYLPARAARFHDVLSLEAVNQFNYANIGRLDIDSRPGLALFLKLLEEKQASRFTLLEHANSAELTHAMDTLETTSYITGYFTHSEKELSPSHGLVQTALVVGRVDESPEVAAGLDSRSKQYSFEYLQRLLTGQQFTIASRGLVSPSLRSTLSRLGFTGLVDTESIFELGAVKVGYMVESSTVRAKELTDQGVRVVCIASDDMGIEAYHGGLIVRGLGSFLTADILSQPESTTITVGLAVEDGQLRVYLLPVQYTRGKGRLLVGQADDTLLATIAARSAVSATVKEQIKKGILTISLK